MVEQRMNYLLTALIGSKAAFSRIGYRAGFMNEHMVPGLVLVGLGIVGLVPILISLAREIMCHYDATIMITHMTNQITRSKFGCFVSRQI